MMMTSDWLQLPIICGCIKLQNTCVAIVLLKLQVSSSLIIIKLEIAYNINLYFIWELCFLPFFLDKLKQIYINKCITTSYTTNVPQCGWVCFLSKSKAQTWIRNEIYMWRQCCGTNFSFCAKHLILSGSWDWASLSLKKSTLFLVSHTCSFSSLTYCLPTLWIWSQK